MAGGAVISGTHDASRIEAPVTVKAYLMCAFAAFGGIFFGYDTGWYTTLLSTINTHANLLQDGRSYGNELLQKTIDRHTCK